MDRVDELRDLRAILRSERPTLARVYGRRRLGKTELLRRLCREEQGVYLLVDEADSPRQRESLSRQVAVETGGLVVPYPDWNAFFDNLRRVERRFVVLDEFQRILTAERQAVSRLQHWWDSTLKTTGPSIVLCGSSVGMMERVTAKRAAPLFGRLGADLRLRPFGYAAVRLLYPDLDEPERVRRYSVFGGTPYYHEFSVGRSLKDGVEAAFLSSTAPLVEEPQSLLRLELKAPTRYNSILYEIGQGTHDLRGLESKVGVRPGGLGPYLAILRHDLDLIQMEDPVCGIHRQGRYVFDDPFFAFYYRFVFENRPLLELGRGSAVWSRVERELDAFIGFQFERVARQALVLLNGGDWHGTRVEFDQIGRWWNRTGEEIDIVASGRTEVIVGEVSWSADRMGLGDLRKLEMKARLIERLHGRPIRFCLVSRGGFRSDLLESGDARSALLLTLRDLAEIFDTRYGVAG